MSQTQEQTTELAVAERPSAIVNTSPGLLRPIVRVEEMVESHKELAVFVQKALEEGRDYGQIPGTGDKMNLLKPGAERLLIGFGCASEFEIVEQEADHNHTNSFVNKKWEAVDPPKLPNGTQDKKLIDEWKAAGTHRWKKIGDGWQFQQAQIEAGESLGLYRYVVRAIIRHRASGEVVGTGIGSCSSLESKYIRSPRDAENTILKMAKKRALVDAVLTTFGLSDRFTQDIEEIAENQRARGGSAQEEPVQTAKVAKAVASVEEREAGKWIKEIGLAKAAFESFKRLCNERQITWHELAQEARTAGVTNEAELLAYMDGEIPGEAEAVQATLVEDDGPGESTNQGQTTAQSAGGTAPSPTAATNAKSGGESYSGPTVRDEDDPYADEVGA